MKKFLCLLLLVCMIFNFCNIVVAEKGTDQIDVAGVTLNGNAINFDVPPQLINDRTMVPLRAVFEAMGALVTWEPYNELISVELNGILIELTIGYDFMSIFGKNNRKVWLDSPPCIVDGRTLVPVRAISEALGEDVKWNEDSKTVEIKYNQISHSPLNSNQIEGFKMVQWKMPTFNKDDISTVGFALDFISWATKGEEIFVDGTYWEEKSVNINGDTYILVGNREKCNAEYRLAFGCDLPYFTEKDLPEEIVIFNGEYAVIDHERYWIGFDNILVYDHTEERPEGSYDVIFSSYPSDWVDYGHSSKSVFNISLADNENGYIMNSYHIYEDGVLTDFGF